MNQKSPKSFQEESAGSQRGAFAEFIGFVVHNKKWWLTPVLIVLVLVGALVVLGGTGVAPFIYSLF
jgi:hypothetical protein